LVDDFVSDIKKIYVLVKYIIQIPDSLSNTEFYKSASLSMNFES